jgi:hypothetical protein
MLRLLILLTIMGLTGCKSKEHSFQKTETITNENIELNSKTVFTVLFNTNPVQNDCEIHENLGDGYGVRCKEPHIHRKISHEELAASGLNKFSPISDTAFTRLLCVKFLSNSKDSALALLETILPNLNCQPCSPSIGAAVFYREKNEWANLFYQPHVVNSGSFGLTTSLPKIELAGKNHYGLVFEWSATGQGYNESGIRIFFNFNNCFQEVFSINTGADNSGLCTDSLPKCWSWLSSYSFPKEDNKEWYDLIINSDGTKADSTNIMPVHNKERYVFNGHKYIVGSLTHSI